MTKTRLNVLMLVTILSLLPSLLLGNHLVSASQVPDSRPISNEYYTNKESLQPYGAVLQVDELKHWSPDKDPDARYNRSSIPLKKRYMGPLVNSNASTEAKVMSLAMSNPRASEAKSQGGDGSDVYAFTHFQYVDTYNFWGGSSHEGIIAIPNPEHIDSAHKNGVKATATIFFPWGDSEFVGKAMRQFTEQDEDGNFIVADKLLEIADYYGFEGFFINQESGVSSDQAEKLRDMLVYIQENKPEDFVMQWYDAMVQGGGISHQNGINDINIGMIQDGDRRINDEFFLNFNWGKSRIDTSIDTMKKAGRSSYDIFASWEYFPYTKDPGRVEHLVDDNNVIQTSIGLLSPTTTLTNSRGVDDFQNNEDPKLWVGPTSDPTDTTRNANEFPGISSLVADRTPILGTNFVTHFTAGNGHKFYENGTVTKNKDWYNRSLTDVMPTWRWIVESNGSKLTPKIDYNDAYFAGTSLKVAGNLEAAHPNHIKLYSSKLNINNHSELSITYKAKEATNNMKVGLNFGDTYEDKNFVFFDVEDGSANEWNTVSIDLAEHAGEVVKAISLQFASSEDVENFEVNVGRLAITDETTKPSDIKNITFDEIMFEDYGHAEARMYWDDVDHASLYTIHRVKSDGTKELIGATHNHAFYTGLFEKDGKESGFNFEITPISETGVKGEAKNLHFEWSIPDNTAEFVDQTVRENLALDQPVVSNVTVEKDGPVYNINDGVIPLSKWATVGGATTARPHTATIDLGEEKDISRWVVHHANAPGAGESPDMNTIDFKFRYAADDGEPLLDGDTQESKTRVNGLTFTDADVVTNNKLDITDRNLDEPIKARYIQLYVTNSDRSPWKATRVYEFEVYEEQYDPRTKPINMQFVKAKNNEGATDTVTVSNVTEGDTVYLYTDLTTETVLAEAVASETGIVTFTDLDFGSDAGRIYYSVKNPLYLESVRRSVPFDAESGEKISIPNEDDIRLERSLKGNQLDYAQKFGVLTLKNLPEGVQAEIFEDEDQVFPILLSAPAVNGQIVQERVPLGDDGGKIYVKLIKEGLNSSDRFEVTYDENIAGNTSTLESIFNKYSKIQEEHYLSSSWKAFGAAMKVAKNIIEKGSATVEEILEAQANIIETAKHIEQKGSIRELLALYDEYKELQEELYSISSWEEFAKALADAKEIIEQDDSPQEVILEIQNDLEEAAQQLEQSQTEKVTLTIDEEVLEITKDVGLLALKRQLDNGFDVDIDLEDVTIINENPDIVSIEDGKVTPLKVGSTDIHVKVMIDEVSFESNAITVKVTLDVTPLEDKIKEAQEITNDDDEYTEESFEALLTAIEAAESVLESAETEEDVINGIEALQSAIDGLKKVELPELDLTPLQDKIKEAQEITNDDDEYTEESFEALLTAIETAESVLETAETEEDVTNAVEALQSAIEGLKEVELPELDLTPLKDKIKEAQEITNDDNEYTEESFEALLTAIETAESALETAETEEDVTNAVEALQSAIEGLKEVELPKLDVSTLEDLIREARSLLTEAEKYTIESLDTLEKAIDKAEVAIDEIQTEDELEQAISDLELAIKSLEIDVIELEELIEAAKSIQNEDDKYTKDSFAALQTAIEEAELKLASVETTEDLTKAVKNLQTAIDALEEVVIELDVSELEELIKQAKGISNEDEKYTKESFTALQEAIKRAEENQKSVETAEDLQQIIEDLQAAIDGLTHVNVAEKPTTPEGDKEQGKAPEREVGQGTNTNANANTEAGHGNQLPQTATSMFNWLALGILLVGIGMILVVRRKRA